MKRIKKWKWLLPVLITLMTVILLKSVFLFGYVPTASMEPTIPKGSYILGSRIYGELKTGDVVIFEYEGRLLVKRIAACSGDIIERNGQHLTVPEDSYYMLGDNLSCSLDARFWPAPFISRSDVQAKLIWP